VVPDRKRRWEASVIFLVRGDLGDRGEEGRLPDLPPEFLPSSIYTAQKIGSYVQGAMTPQFLLN